MKNLHLIPTDKPSKLFKDDFGKYFISINIDQEQNHFKPQHIYITSEEKPKAGDWSLYQYKIHKCIEDIVGDEFKKIILTTDQDLIDNGVQDIDTEFLEWFVNNPSCEEVEVDKNWNYPLDKRWEYKIIIPKEEQKQHLIDIMRGDEELGLYEEPKQETLEEFIENGGYPTGSTQEIWEQGVREGAKWQQERMYSEEELLSAFEAGMMFIGEDKGSFGEWFEQFKKK